MKRISWLFMLSAVMVCQAQTNDSLSLGEVVVTGTRNPVDVRHLPMTVTVVDRQTLTEQHQTSILPTLVYLTQNIVYVGARSCHFSCKDTHLSQNGKIVGNNL